MKIIYELDENDCYNAQKLLISRRKIKNIVFIFILMNIFTLLFGILFYIKNLNLVIKLYPLITACLLMIPAYIIYSLLIQAMIKTKINKMKKIIPEIIGKYKLEINENSLKVENKFFIAKYLWEFVEKKYENDKYLILCFHDRHQLVIPINKIFKKAYRYILVKLKDNIKLDYDPLLLDKK